MNKIMFLTIIFIISFSIIGLSAAPTEPIPSYVWWGGTPDFVINETVDFDAGTKNNTESVTDYDNVTDNTIQLTLGSIFRDNLDYEAEGTSPPADWTPDGAKPPSSLEVDDIHSKTNSHSIYVNNAGGALDAFHHDVNFVDEPYIIWLYFEDTAHSHTVAILDTAGNWVAGSISVHLSFLNTGDIKWYDGAYQDTGVDYTTGWHKVRILPNHVANTFDMWYDDTQIITNGNFRNAAVSGKQIAFGESGTSTLWIDDIKLGGYETSGNWTSDDITVTVNSFLENFTINISQNYDFNNITNITLISDTDVVLAYNLTEITTTGLINYSDANGFDSGTISDIDNGEKFKIVVNFQSNGTNTTIVEDIIGYYESVLDAPIMDIQSPTNTTYCSGMIYHNVTIVNGGTIGNASWCGVSTNGGVNITMTWDHGYDWYYYGGLIAQGNYENIFCCNNTQDLMNCSTSVNYTFDNTPTLTIQIPQNISYCDTSIWFNATLSFDGSWFGYSLDGGVNITMTNSSGNWNNFAAMICNGTIPRNVIFYGNDTCGNMATATEYFSFCCCDDYTDVAIVLGLDLIALILFYIYLKLDKERNYPLKLLFLHLIFLFIYIGIMSSAIIAEDAGMTSLENILETIGIVWMWIWILLFIYFVIRLLFYVADWRKRTREEGVTYESEIEAT